MHGAYYHFVVSDQKRRDIHKASVRDRIVHHAIYRSLYPYFDSRFIFDSYSCRNRKGHHRALDRFECYIQKETNNNTKTARVLKCDIRKCFASVNHQILKDILSRDIKCPRTLEILNIIIDSFCANPGSGIPLGNLTSQLFINIYLDILDKYVKGILKVDRYIRYADDFIFISQDKYYLHNLWSRISGFLNERLKLSLNPQLRPIRTIYSGIDFLGWVNFPKYRVLRTSTRRKMFHCLTRNSFNSTIYSYLGLLGHGNAYRLIRMLSSY